MPITPRSRAASATPKASRDADTRRDVLVIKIGGSVSAEADPALDAVVSLHDGGHPLVVVHGGGPVVGEWSSRFGLETRFVRGLRVTDAATRDVALAVLAGLANTRTVSALLARGVPAMLRAERESDELGLVGRITRVDSAVLEELVDAGRVPVVAPAAIEAPGDGEPLDEVFNVNADSVAGAIAASLSARLLVFVTDVPGVRAKDGKVIGSLDLGRAKALIDDGTIEGGMLPKVEACLVAARAGCRAAIVAAQGADAVERLLAGDSIGTVFEAAA
ncbi:MAG: acetylglutamate kinase [Chloroflexi bacterium]|nr:MAG: acetylglutamate kinase [Chloroflexota bacterium]